MTFGRLEQLMLSLAQTPPNQIALRLYLAAALMYLFHERRLSVLCLLLMRLLLASLMLASFYRPIALISVGLGIATAIMLFLTAWRLQSGVEGSARDELTQTTGSTQPNERGAIGGPGIGFRLLALGLSTLLVYGVWQRYPMDVLTDSAGLVLYGLLGLGLLMILTSADPLRQGLGLLTLLCAFQIVFLFLESSLLVVTLWGILEIVLALAISYLSECWLTASRGEPLPP